MIHHLLCHHHYLPLQLPNNESLLPGHQNEDQETLTLSFGPIGNLKFFLCYYYLLTKLLSRSTSDDSTPQASGSITTSPSPPTELLPTTPTTPPLLGPLAPDILHSVDSEFIKKSIINSEKDIEED